MQELIARVSASQQRNSHELEQLRQALETIISVRTQLISGALASHAFSRVSLTSNQHLMDVETMMLTTLNIIIPVEFTLRKEIAKLKVCSVGWTIANSALSIFTREEQQPEQLALELGNLNAPNPPANNL